MASSASLCPANDASFGCQDESKVAQLLVLEAAARATETMEQELSQLADDIAPSAAEIDSAVGAVLATLDREFQSASCHIGADVVDSPFYVRLRLVGSLGAGTSVRGLYDIDVAAEVYMPHLASAEEVADALSTYGTDLMGALNRDLVCITGKIVCLGVEPDCQDFGGRSVECLDRKVDVIFAICQEQLDSLLKLIPSDVENGDVPIGISGSFSGLRSDMVRQRGSVSAAIRVLKQWAALVVGPSIDKFPGARNATGYGLSL